MNCFDRLILREEQKERLNSKIVVWTGVVVVSVFRLVRRKTALCKIKGWSPINLKVNEFQLDFQNEMENLNTSSPNASQHVTLSNLFIHRTGLKKNSNTRAHPNITLGKGIHANTAYIYLKMPTIKCPKYVVINAYWWWKLLLKLNTFATLCWWDKGRQGLPSKAFCCGSLLQ